MVFLSIYGHIGDGLQLALASPHQAPKPWPRYGERPLCSIALCYVFYSVLRLLFLFARTMAMALCGSKLLSETELSKFRTQLFFETYFSMVFIMQVRGGNTGRRTPTGIHSYKQHNIKLI